MCAREQKRGAGGDEAGRRAKGTCRVGAPGVEKGVVLAANLWRAVPRMKVGRGGKGGWRRSPKRPFGETLLGKKGKWGKRVVVPQPPLLPGDGGVGAVGYWERVLEAGRGAVKWSRGPIDSRRSYHHFALRHPLPDPQPADLQTRPREAQRRESKGGWGPEGGVGD